jgi:osmotically-inducible protein OsmY
MHEHAALGSHTHNMRRHSRRTIEGETLMNATTRKQFLAVIAASTLVFAAGCSDTSNQSGTVGQKVDRTTDKMAASTERAATNTAVAVDDATITTKVKAAVLAEPGLRSLQINVDTKDGRVTLAGTVDNAELKQRATQVAQSVEGVKSVTDQLTVKSS